MTTRRIMRTFKMNEISAVDRPAQVGARMRIMKRDDHPITNRNDLEKAILAIGQAADPAAAKADIIARAQALGATSALPDGWVQKRIEDMTEAEIQALIGKAVTTATAALTKQLQDTTAALDTLQKAAKKPPFVADGDQEPDGDDAAKKAWRTFVEKAVAKALAKQAETHAAEIAKRDAIEKGDETFIAEGGAVIRKSDYAKPEHFALAKAQHDKLELQDFTKRAETEVAHLSGETLAKAKALRAISRLEKADRDAIEAMLKGGNAAMKANMGQIGHNASVATSADGEIEKLARAYEAQHKVPYHDAYSKVLETTEGKELYAKSRNERRAA